MVSFLFLSSFRFSALFASRIICVVFARWVASGFLGALSSSVFGSFLRRFLFLLVRVAFALLLALP